MPDPPALAPLTLAVATANMDSWRSFSSSSLSSKGAKVSCAGGRHFKRVTEAEMERTCRKFFGVALCREAFIKAALEVDDMVREFTVIMVVGPIMTEGLRNRTDKGGGGVCIVRKDDSLRADPHTCKSAIVMERHTHPVLPPLL